MAIPHNSNSDEPTGNFSNDFSSDSRSTIAEPVTSTLQPHSDDDLTARLARRLSSRLEGGGFHRMEEQLEELARHVTAASAAIGDEINAFNPTKDSNLDPSSPNFDSVAWAKAFIRLFESGPDAPPERKSGVAFKNLSVSGFSTGSEYQRSTGNVLLSAFSSAAGLLTGREDKRRIDILQDFAGVVEDGEMLVVLGPPGAGCSTLLKTLSGQTSGLNINQETYMNFRGINPRHMHDWFRGDVLYNAEIDVHLPHLSVGETLDFASRARLPYHIPGGFTAIQAGRVLRDVMMAIFGISRTVHTRVGNDYVRGISGGERKRVSIAEAALTGAKFQCWDNSTRGLDSANAIQFCKNLRIQADLMDVAAVVAIYQAPQSAYDLFDKVTVLYEGRQIFFGRIGDAKAYFEDLGFDCPARQTTPDFLTSMTSPQERRVRPGYENLAPRTPDEFAKRWKSSPWYAALMAEIDEYERNHPSKERLEEFTQSRRAERSSSQRLKSPYTLSYWRQAQLCMWRGWRRLIADPQFTIAQLLFNLVMALVLGSMFYNLKPDSSSFYYRGGLMFFSLLFNAFSSQLEVLTLYAQRPVVEKHNRYAFYHQSAEAISSYLLDLPYKTGNMFMFNIILYFMANLRRDPGPFFFFCLASYLTLLVMSAIYRTLASVTRTSHQAMVPSSLLTLGLMIYTGFTIPTSYMLGWSRWMNYINPLAYAFEALMANEFHGREFPCAQMIPAGPGYENLASQEHICAVIGAVPGSSVVNGDAYIGESFGYYNSNKWRNIGILIAYLVFFFIAYIVAAEYSRPPASKGEILVFRRGKIPPALEKAQRQHDEEGQSDARLIAAEKTTPIDSTNSTPESKVARLPSELPADKSVFHWEDLCYDITIKGEPRRILDHLDGWVQPGTSTALMGASGAGKTTLLDTLATRVTTGVVSGTTLIDGNLTDESFPHRVGYVQQQDLHLSTMTVREALEFSALLRQNAEIPREEKLAYIDEVIKMLDMEEFVDAVIGVPGEGLNVEQRKRLTIGVELAARPQLLVFLDEPTSGLDSQTSWAICDLIEKLTQSGQAVLCTIHQPSAMLFQRFDRLLLLQPGGRTVYFGELGKNATTLINYLERNGAPSCPPDANPAEWMLNVTKPTVEGQDWFETWRNSAEYREVKAELARLQQRRSKIGTRPANSVDQSASQHQEFVASFTTQFVEVFKRVAKHFWRSPTYMYSKISLVAISSLYVGFSFNANNSLQGLQNQLYAFFMYLPLFGNLNEQIMPPFVPQRAIYEVRERPSRMYRWTTYLLSNIFVEIFWNTVMAAIMFFCWYYPVGFFRNTDADDVTERGFLVFLFLWMFMLFVSTFSHLIIASIEAPELAGIPASLIWMLCISFCGVGVARADIPSFWNFMYRLSPATYLVSGVLSTSIHGSPVVCASNEILRMAPPANMTCGEFLGPYAQAAGGYILDAMATENCGYCRLSYTDQFLATFEIHYSDRWRNFGLLWVYVIVNILGAMGLYWIFRVPKGQKLGHASSKP